MLPSHLAGDSHSDPKVRELNKQLRDMDHKIAHNELDIPPEGQRSPSPEPVYDKMGVRLNTREIRYRERLLDNRHRELHRQGGGVVEACRGGMRSRACMEPHAVHACVHVCVRMVPSRVHDRGTACLPMQTVHAHVRRSPAHRHSTHAHTNTHAGVIEELIKEDPNFKPPPDYKPRKFQRRLRIPQVRGMLASRSLRARAAQPSMPLFN